MTHQRGAIPTPCPAARAARRIVRALAAGLLAASITACDVPRASSPVGAPEEGQLAAFGLERGDDANARVRPAIVLRPVGDGASTAVSDGVTADGAYGTATIAADVRRLEIRASGAAQK